MARFSILAIFFSALVQFCFGQSIGISTDGSTPHASAALEIKSTSKGILIARMTMAERDLINTPANGLLIYQTDHSPGFYYFNGASWTSIAGQSTNGWALTGNPGTNPSTDFIGTTDDQPIRFRVNNTWAGRFSNNSYYIGDSSGIASTLNNHYSVGIGYRVLRKSTSGFYNVALGTQAMEESISASNCVAVGHVALSENTIGDENTAIGSRSLTSNTTGETNTAIGSGALLQNFSGHNNTAVGGYALSSNAVGGDNTAVGSLALTSCMGSFNTAVGDRALTNTTSGLYNTAVGQRAAMDNSTGSENVAIGAWALQNSSSASNNVAIGSEAMINNITGTYNIAIGRTSGVSASFNNTISLGNHGYLNASNNQAFLGNLSTLWNGGNVAWSTFSDARVKKDIAEDVKGLEFITRLRPVTYHRDIDAQTALTGNSPSADFTQKYDIEQIKFSGFIAQEVEQAALASGYDFSGITAPRNAHEIYTLSYESFVPTIIKGMQELVTLVNDQQLIIEQQREQMASLKDRMAQIETHDANTQISQHK